MPRRPVIALALYDVAARRERAAAAADDDAAQNRARLAAGLSNAEIERALALARALEEPGNFARALDRALLTQP